MSDPRGGSALYYDLDSAIDDVDFYLERVRGDVLELGCGTGRVSAPLAEHGARVVGVDFSRDMLDRCRQKSADIELVEADIASVDLGRRFDWVIAPFRVFQTLETDVRIGAFFRVVRRHLGPGGRCILNAFDPRGDRHALIERWSSPAEEIEGEATLPDGDVVRKSVLRSGVSVDPLVLRPVLIWRRFRGERLMEEVRVPIAMRVHYPAELMALVESHGFTIHESWGGYRGEPYGSGTELVLELS